MNQKSNMAGTRSSLILVSSLVGPQQHEQVNTVAPVEAATTGPTGPLLDEGQTLPDSQILSDPEVLEAADILLQLRASQSPLVAETQSTQQDEMISAPQLGPNPFDNPMQVPALDQFDRHTVNPELIAFTWTSTPLPFPSDQPYIIANANAAPLPTLHFIETGIFGLANTWQETWHELWKQNIFIPLDAMRDILRQWLAIIELAMFRQPRDDESFSPSFLIILERYQNKVRRGDVERLHENWKLLNAMLDGTED